MSSTFGCPHCGKTNPLSATFCASCGTYLKGMDAASLARLAAAAEPPEDETPPARPTETAPAPPAASQPWLDPDFDAEASPAPTPPEVDQQPWLRPEKETQDADAPPAPAPQRLIGGLQGLIEPVDMERSLSRPDSPAPAVTPLNDLPYEMRRELREIFATDVPVLDELTPENAQPGQPGQSGAGLWQRNWIYGLVLATLFLALWTANAPPGSRPHSWPGLREAHTAIAALPSDSLVLINWAYDPASAGEMDLVALPVVEHLLQKSPNLLVVSQLPGGPATARRLFAVAGAAQSATLRQRGEIITEGGYLPGGIGSLPLLGQSPAQGLPVDARGRSLDSRAALNVLETDGPDLLVIFAARSEEVQRWLEQIQPLNRAPIVAVTGAAVDPAIRPYVDSGQISGLVSGYAGGMGYRELLADPAPTAEQEAQRRQITAQNWALVVLLLVVGVGNLAGLAERRQR